MKVSVVILNWNTKEYLKRFLPGVIQSCRDFGDAGVVVADNGSSDGSKQLMKDEFPEVKLIPLGDNFGFAGGYNRALKELDSDYAVLLNTDVEVSAGWLSPLVSWMDVHPECAATGPKIKSFSNREYFEYAGAAGGLLDAFGFPFCRGRVLNRIEQDKGQFDGGAENVFWLSGACLMVRMDVWRMTGGLDERFFAHMEEIDWCWRAQLSGFDITFIPESTIYHIGGGTLNKDSASKLMLNFRNNLLMLENNLAKTLAAEGKDVKKSLRMANRRIFVRRLLDVGAMVIYAFTLKFPKAGAVVDAHHQYKRLRIRQTTESLSCWLKKPHRRGYLNGVFAGSIFIETIIHPKI